MIIKKINQFLAYFYTLMEDNIFGFRIQVEKTWLVTPTKCRVKKNDLN